MAKYSSRLSQLETTHFQPSPIHIITKSYGDQPHGQHFDTYQAKRTAEGYAPQQGWEQLRTEFLSENNKIDDMIFTTFDIVGGVAPGNSNVEKCYEMVVI